jgi:hypothetical protein
MLALGLAPFLGLLPGVAAVLVAVIVAAFSWRPEVKASYHPPREVGSTFPIPPEMTPPDVLDAAHVDDKGRPL